jgi:hypothetical protein
LTKIDFLEDLIRQPTYALNKIQFKTSIKFLHVLALGINNVKFLEDVTGRVILKLILRNEAVDWIGLLQDSLTKREYCFV